jgi:hypothetical protein
VDDRFAAVRGRSEALGAGHVPLGELAAPGLEPLAAATVADEAANVPAVGAKRVDDVAADKTAPTRDEDHVVDSPAKFCQ